MNTIINARSLLTLTGLSYQPDIVGQGDIVDFVFGWNNNPNYEFSNKIGALLIADRAYLVVMDWQEVSPGVRRVDVVESLYGSATGDSIYSINMPHGGSWDPRPIYFTQGMIVTFQSMGLFVQNNGTVHVIQFEDAQRPAAVGEALGGFVFMRFNPTPVLTPVVPFAEMSAMPVPVPGPTPPFTGVDSGGFLSATLLYMRGIDGTAHSWASTLEPAVREAGQVMTCRALNIPDPTLRVSQIAFSISVGGLLVQNQVAQEDHPIGLFVDGLGFGPLAPAPPRDTFWTDYIYASELA